MTKSVLDYLSGLTAFALEESVLVRIALDRGVTEEDTVKELDLKTKELMHADILFTVIYGPSDLPSFTHQHGQFSHTMGKQNFGDKDRLYALMRSIYKKYDDPKLDILEESALSWMD